MAIKLINGCSKEVNRNALSDMFPKESNPRGETKYKIMPANNCMCDPIKPKRAIFLSFGVNSFFEDNPKIELTTTITNNNNAKYAHPE